MASRKEQKARLREERLARERAAAVAEHRSRRLRNLGLGAAALLVAVAVAVAIAAGGGSGGGAKAPGGLQTGTPPWPPETSNLQARLAALNFPPEGEAYHVHAVIRIFTDDKQVPVPANIGIDQGSGTMAPLHTHDQSGTIHMEAASPYPFKLGQFFTVWGVKFTHTQLGGLSVGGNRTLQVFVNGKSVDPVTYALKSHDKIVVAYGKPGSAPKSFSYSFPPGE